MLALGWFWLTPARQTERRAGHPRERVGRASAARAPAQRVVAAKRIGPL